jgi:hypothetical protein
MQWDISKIFRPMGRDTFQKLFIPWDGILFKNFSSHGMGYISKISIHPIPWDVILLKNVPWDGMGWDGMGRDGTGWDYPIPRGALLCMYCSLHL